MALSIQRWNEIIDGSPYLGDDPLWSHDGGIEGPAMICARPEGHKGRHRMRLVECGNEARRQGWKPCDECPELNDDGTVKV